MKKPTPEPGEWQTEVTPFGGVRRYRMIGNCKEYEMEINGLPQSVFLESNRRMKEKREAEHEETRRREKETAAQQRNCPFADGIHTNCSQEKCALYVDGCALARLTGRPPAKNTAGLQCPLGRAKTPCRTDCALYKNGCTLIG